MNTTTKTWTGSYLSARAEVTEVRTAGAAGLRAVIHRWIDDAKGQRVEHPAGTVEIRIIKGNGLKGTLVELASLTLAPEHAEFASDHAERMLAEHFGGVR